MTLVPSDKAALLLYWKAVRDTLEQDNLPPSMTLGLIQKGLKMTREAYMGVICLQCGLPWAEHPKRCADENCRLFGSDELHCHVIEIKERSP